MNGVLQFISILLAAAAHQTAAFLPEKPKSPAFNSQPFLPVTQVDKSKPKAQTSRLNYALSTYDFTEKLSSTADGLYTFSAAAENWDECESSLTHVSKLLDGAEEMSKLSAGLSLLGFSMGAATSIATGAGHDADKMIVAIYNLGTIYEGVQNSMSAKQLDVIEDFVNLDEISSQLRTHVTKLDSVGELVQNYQKAVKANDPGGVKEYETRLRQGYSRVSVQEDVDGIVELASKVFEAAHDDSSESLSTISRVGLKLFNSCKIGIVADGLLSSLEQKEKDIQTATVKHVENTHGESIKEVYKSWERAFEKCKKKVGSKMESGRKLKRKIQSKIERNWML